MVVRNVQDDLSEAGNRAFCPKTQQFERWQCPDTLR